jgi:hypothetical protein
LQINFAQAAQAATALRSNNAQQLSWSGQVTSGNQSLPLILSQLVSFRR